MGLPEKSAVVILALAATAFVVCALFFCGEAQEIQQGLASALKPEVPLVLPVEIPVEGASEARTPFDLPQPPDCPQAVIDDLESPLATRADPGQRRTPCTWYQRKGLKPVWLIRPPTQELHDGHQPTDRTVPLIRSLASPKGPRPGHLYRLRAGDTLPAIALEAYGDVKRWTDIWMANTNRFPDGVLQGEDVEIWIPE